MEEKFTVMESSSSSGTTKRSRAHSFGAQVPSCLVDGCVSDLSKCRDYHRRHKVCELHSKTPKVTIGGQERRFCQQCSRFHSLIEFDDGKRSCRKRLDGHNRRRRKPQPESIALNSGRFPSYQDSKFFPFGIPQLFSTSDAVSSPWVGTVKAENDASSPSLLSFGDRRRSSSPSSSIPRYKGKQFPFLHGSRDPAIPEASICQSFLKPNYGSDNCSNSQKAYSDGLNRVIDSDRTRALSLLSTPAETREICFSSMVHQHSLNPPPVQSLIPNVHYSGLRMEEKNLNSSLISNESRNTNNIQQCHGMVSDPTMPLDGSSSSGPHQTLSFWE